MAQGVQRGLPSMGRTTLGPSPGPPWDPLQDHPGTLLGPSQTLLGPLPDPPGTPPDPPGPLWDPLLGPLLTLLDPLGPSWDPLGTLLDPSGTSSGPVSGRCLDGIGTGLGTTRGSRATEDGC